MHKPAEGGALMEYTTHQCCGIRTLPGVRRCVEVHHLVLAGASLQQHTSSVPLRGRCHMGALLHSFTACHTVRNDLWPVVQPGMRRK